MWKRNREYTRLKNKFIYYLSLLVILLALLLFIVFRKTFPVYYEKVDYALGTYVKVYVASDKINPERLAEIAIKEIRRIEAKFSANNPNSIIYQLNEKREIIADDETLFLIKASLNFSKLTGGAFDITIRSLLELWGFDDVNSKKRVPSPNELSLALSGVGYKFIKIEGNKIKLINPLTKVDLGGIAKGYALDMAAEKIKELDPKATGYIDAGGDIKIIGPKYGNRPWVIGIRDPFHKDGIVDVIHLYHGAVATSGDYERYFELNGKIYHHILDPKTGKPAYRSKSVTVISESCMKADALATGIFVLGFDMPNLNYFTRFNAQVLIISPKGEKKETDGFEYYKKKH